ncbi:PKD domain-containing protein [Mucilaginibacter sp. AW1-3]
MKLLFKATALVALLLLLINDSFAQSGSSNIGTEFWTGYMDHINGVGGTSGSQMILYIASDVSTSGTVAINDNSFTSIAFTVTPNQVTQVPIPSAAFLGNTNGMQNKGIHITSKNPIAVYAHIYASSVSGATLLLPVNTMANDYYSLNYTQNSNATPSYGLFMVIATEDNTTVQITPTVPLINGAAANTPFTITLNKGQVYQGIANNADLTGTHIASISNGGSGCKKIAVFSGSNKIYIGKPNNSSDNLFQQVYPTASWGKNYITVPLKSRNYDVYRIVLSDPNTTVKLNGSVVPAASFTNSLYYEFKSQSTNVISADKPIQVVQYAVTQGNGINGTTIAGDVGDPEMIYLNPLEQTIDHVTLYSTDKYKILNGFINVVIPAAAVSSFQLDGVSQAALFTPVTNNVAYSSAQLSVTVNATHVLSASQGFNAIAYGFGGTESYGYAAGTNVKNLNEYVQYADPNNSSAVYTASCTGSALEPQVVIPYATTSITWDLGNGSAPVTQLAPTYKSTFTKGGTQLYLYGYGQAVAYNTAGTYAIKATVVDPITTVCGSNEEIDLNYVVSDPPQIKFASRDSVCVTDTVGFKDQTNGLGNVLKSWHWDFGNGDTSAVQHPVYTYPNPGDYTVSLTVTSSSGCVNVGTKKIHVRALPVPAYTFSYPDCETQAITFTDASTTAEGKITQWTWNYGDGTAAETKTTNTPFQYVFAKAGSYTVKLQISTNKGCFSSSVNHTVVVHPQPVIDFGLPDVCLVNAIAQFTDKTTTADTSKIPFKYLWDFGDANATTANPNNSFVKNPAHQFIKAGVYHISLTVKSKDTCIVTTTKDFTVNGQANFTAQATACPGDSVLFTDKTDGTNKIVSAWHWDFGNGDTSNVQNPKYAYATAGNYTAKLTVTGHNGCSITNFSQGIHINKKPVADFTYSTPDCETKSITFTDKSTAAEGTVTSWLWDFGDGSMTSTLQNPTHTFSPYKTYIVTLIVTTNLGCSSTSVSKSVIVNQLPVADFVIPDVCANDGVAIFTAIPDKNGLVYTWDFGDVTATITNPNTATGLTVTHSYPGIGTYNAKLTVITKDGCSKDTIKQFKVNGSSPKANFIVLNSTTLCSSREVFFVDSATVPGFGNGDVTSVDMYYDYANNPTAKTHYERPTVGQLFRYSYPVNNTTISKKYKVHMVAYSGVYPTTTCVSTCDKLITLLPVPVVTFKIDSQVCINGNVITLSSGVSIQNGPVGTPVFTIDGVTSSDGIFYPAIAGLGKHSIKCVYTSPNTCADTLTQNITVEPAPAVSTVYDVLILAGGQAKLQATATGNNLTYLWMPATGLSNNKILNPIASPSVDTKYKLTVTSTTNGTSCPVTDSVFVKVLLAPVIPSAFTPNGDGINDTWQIQYLDSYPGCTIDIFNRNGEKVFSSLGYSTAWDGRYNGVILPVGAYYYIIDPKHGRSKISGVVTIIR